MSGVPNSIRRLYFYYRCIGLPAVFFCRISHCLSTSVLYNFVQSASDVYLYLTYQIVSSMKVNLAA